MSRKQYEQVMAAVGEEMAERLRQEAHADTQARLKRADEIRARLLSDPWSVACVNLGSGGPAWKWDGETISWNLDLAVVLIEVEPDPEVNTHVNDIHQLYARAIIETVDPATANRIAVRVADMFRDMEVCLRRREDFGPMHPNTRRWDLSK